MPHCHTLRSVRSVVPRLGIVIVLAAGAVTSASAQETPGPAARSTAAVAGAPLLRLSTTPEGALLQESERGRWGDYVNDVIGPWALIGIVGRSAFDHVQEDPEAWGDDSEGFFKRLGSNAGRRFVQESVHHGLAYALDRSTDYQPCGCSDFGGKLGNAFLEAITDRDEQGGRAFSVAQIAGNYAGAFAPLLWLPEDEQDAGKAAINGTTAFIFTAAGNFLLTELLGFGR